MIEEKLTEEGLINRGLCLFQPSTICDKDYSCKKLNDNPPRYFHATPDPIFICPDKMPDKLKEMMGIK